MLIQTAEAVVNLQAPLEEMARASISYLNDTSRQLTNAIEKDISDFLEKHADNAKTSFLNND